MPPTLEQAIAAVRQLPNLPNTTRVVLDYLNDEDVDVSRVVQAIARDQGLVARVLRIANSAFFGMPSQVQTIHEAVVVLGFSNLRLIVIAAMMTSQKFSNLTSQLQEVQTLFRHGLAVAICATVFGRKTKLNPNLLFLAGILHDIGKLALMATYPASYAQVQALRGDTDFLTLEAEQKVFGFNHAAIGAALCRHWKLPEAISTAVGDHHSFDDVHDVVPASTETGQLSELIHLADAVAHGLDLESDPIAMVPPISESIWNRLAGRQEQLVHDFSEIRALYQELVTLVDSHS
ncbi:MAG: HDOD domain-containing protein [Rhodoferax sp.]|nr:HDOD domain-containing protein [Rhodoferax sp.]